MLLLCCSATLTLQCYSLLLIFSAAAAAADLELEGQSGNVMQPEESSSVFSLSFFSPKFLTERESISQALQ